MAMAFSRACPSIPALLGIRPCWHAPFAAATGSFPLVSRRMSYAPPIRHRPRDYVMQRENLQRGQPTIRVVADAKSVAARRSRELGKRARHEEQPLSGDHPACRDWPTAIWAEGPQLRGQSGQIPLPGQGLRNIRRVPEHDLARQVTVIRQRQILSQKREPSP